MLLNFPASSSRRNWPEERTPVSPKKEGPAMKEKEVSEEAVFVSGEIVRARKRKLRSILGEGKSTPWLIGLAVLC